MKNNLIQLIKYCALLSLLSFSSTYAKGGGTSANSNQKNIYSYVEKSYRDREGIYDNHYRIIPILNYLESQKLPPDLWVSFEIKCYQTFIKVIRNDIYDPKTNKVTIVIGGLVSEVPSLPCESSMTISELAGSTFSGREFEVKTVD